MKSIIGIWACPPPAMATFDCKPTVVFYRDCRTARRGGRGSLKRTPNPDHTTTLVESREIKNVDGKPATSQDMDGPTLLRGAFEGGLAIVFLNQTACMNYALQRINRNRPAEPYIVRLATVLTPQNSPDCLLQENSKGRVFIDPASMQIAHLELKCHR